MHEMNINTIDIFKAWVSVSHPVFHAASLCANTAKRIEVLFGVDTLGYPRNIRHGPDSPRGSDMAFAEFLWSLNV